LDAGCGDGFFHTRIKNKADEIHGIELNKGDLNIAKYLNPNNIYKTASIYKIPYKDNYFDTVICMDVLEHLRYDKKVVKELTRVLKKNGLLIITVPNKDFPFSFDPINYVLKFFNTHTNAGVWGYGHLRLYKKDIFENLIKNHGFHIIETKIFSGFIVGIFENSYIANLFQPFVKSDPKNKYSRKKNIIKLKNKVKQPIPKFLVYFIRFVIWLDNLYLQKSKKSLNLILYQKNYSKKIQNINIHILFLNKHV
jgi:SAM-dependent methyltransferase